MRYVFIMISFALLFSSCQDNLKTPSGALESYVKKIARATLSLEEQKEIFTGKILEDLEQMNEEDFEQYQRSSQLDKLTVKILRESCLEATKCNVTYLLSYKTETKNNEEFKTELKKIAGLTRVDDVWKIHSIQNLKTYHENKEGINVLEN